MVKRILENGKYLGTDVYPRLISDEEFLAAQIQREDKTDYAPCPAALNPVREKAVCAVCGSRIARDTKSHGRPRWVCPDCGAIVHISDEEVQKRVSHRLRPAPHHVAEGGLSLPCHYRTAFPIRSVSSRPLSRVNFRVSAETITIRLTSDSNSSWLGSPSHWGHDDAKSRCPVPQVPEVEITAALLRLYHKLKADGGTILRTVLEQLRELRERELRTNRKISDIDKEIARLSEQNLVLVRRQGTVSPPRTI